MQGICSNLIFIRQSISCGFIAKLFYLTKKTVQDFLKRDVIKITWPYINNDIKEINFHKESPLILSECQKEEIFKGFQRKSLSMFR